MARNSIRDPGASRLAGRGEPRIAARGLPGVLPGAGLYLSPKTWMLSFSPLWAGPAQRETAASSPRLRADDAAAQPLVEIRARQAIGAGLRPPCPARRDLIETSKQLMG